MYLQFLSEVVRRAFQPTTRVTDMLQIIAASALPGISKFLGVKLPATVGNDVLAYIGTATLAFIVIRLFWAPYSMWKEDRLAIERLKLDLSKPERLVTKSLAKHKAKAIQKLKAEIANTHTATYNPNVTDRDGRIAHRLMRIEKFTYQAGLDRKFSDICFSFFSDCARVLDAKSQYEGMDDDAFLNLLMARLDGSVTDEFLRSQLPLSTVQKTPL